MKIHKMIQVLVHTMLGVLVHLYLSNAALPKAYLRALVTLRLQGVCGYKER